LDLVEETPKRYATNLLLERSLKSNPTDTFKSGYLLDQFELIVFSFNQST